MPSSDAFAKGFGLGMRAINNILGCKAIIKKIKISHKPIEVYQKYEYPITIIADKEHAEMLLKYLNTTLIKESKIIYSQYGNPYKCDIPRFTATYSEKQMKIEATGIGIKVKK